MLSEDEGDPLLRAALEEYKSDAAVRELVAEVRRNSSMPLTSGNRVGALIDGPQTYAAIESELKTARHHIHLETFIFGADEIGRRFGELLAQKRKEGVEVRVLYDSVGSMDTPKDFFEQLRKQGIEVREFRPMNPIKNPRIWDINNRDHRKIIVDRRQGRLHRRHQHRQHVFQSVIEPAGTETRHRGWLARYAHEHSRSSG